MTRVVRFGFGTNGRQSAWLFEPGVGAALLWNRSGEPAWAPVFRCLVCGAGMGGRGTHKIADRAYAVWRPTGCDRCERRAKQRETSKRRRKNPRVLAGVDVDRAVAALRKLPVFTEMGDRNLPIKVEVGHRSRGGVGGRAWSWQRRVRIYGGPTATRSKVLEVVLHELCHIATPRCQHNERFRRVFQRAAREAWNICVPIDVDRGHLKNASYMMGVMISDQLARLIADGLVATFPPAPKVAKRREARVAELVEKRAAHALKMLKQSERRLRIAKTVHARWAKRVGYYERVAARRGK